MQCHVPLLCSVKAIVIDLDDDVTSSSPEIDQAEIDQAGIQSRLANSMGRDLHQWYRDIIDDSLDEHECKMVDSDHPLFLACTR